MSRSVRNRYPAVSDDIGDLRTQRPLPNDELEQIDPFLFLNHHGPQVYPPNASRTRSCCSVTPSRTASRSSRTGRS